MYRCTEVNSFSLYIPYLFILFYIYYMFTCSHKEDKPSISAAFRVNGTPFSPVRQVFTCSLSGWHCGEGDIEIIIWSCSYELFGCGGVLIPLSHRTIRSALYLISRLRRQLPLLPSQSPPTAAPAVSPAGSVGASQPSAERCPPDTHAPEGELFCAATKTW